MPRYQSQQRWRTSRELQLRARELREEMPPAEVHLWQVIRHGQIDGAHFRRQHAIGTYILDFYCAKAKFAIELDGSQHIDREEYDAERTRWLEEHKGIRVIRFANYDVLWILNDVLEKIGVALKGSPPWPSPVKEHDRGGNGFLDIF
jgi:very-short-patch-repair endonuclease